MATKYFNEGLEIVMKIYGEMHPYYASTLSDMGTALLEEGKF